MGLARTPLTFTSRGCGPICQALVLGLKPCEESATDCCHREVAPVKSAVPIRPALRVALAATIAVAIGYLAIVAAIVLLVSNNLVHETTARVAEQLSGAQSLTVSQLSSRDPVRRDADDPPVYFWQLGPTGTVVAASSGAPQLPRDLATRSRQFPRTESIEGSSFRFGAVQRADGTELIAAESLAQLGHVRSVLLTSALAVSPLFLAAVFGCAFVIGRAASKPVEQARVRQLEFAAD